MDLKSVAKPVGDGAEAAAAQTKTVQTNAPEAATSGPSSRRLVVGRSEERIQPKGAITLESVIGLDERTRIVATEQAPWRMICALAIEGRGHFVGTAGWSPENGDHRGPLRL